MIESEDQDTQTHRSYHEACCSPRFLETCQPQLMLASLISQTSHLQLFTTRTHRWMKGLVGKPCGWFHFAGPPEWAEPVHSKEMSIIYCQTPLRKLLSPKVKPCDFLWRESMIKNRHWGTPYWPFEYLVCLHMSFCACVCVADSWVAVRVIMIWPTVWRV